MFYQIITIGIHAEVNKGLLTLIVQGIVKTHSDAARLGQNLLDDVAAKRIPLNLVRKAVP